MSGDRLGFHIEIQLTSAPHKRKVYEEDVAAEVNMQTAQRGFQPTGKQDEDVQDKPSQTSFNRPVRRLDLGGRKHSVERSAVQLTLFSWTV